jgi:hypothetical protein
VFYIDPEAHEVEYVSTLNPVTPSNLDQWGSSLALSLNYAFVGSERALRSEEDAGQVQVFERTGEGGDSMWAWHQTLLGMDVANYRFGSSIAATPAGTRVIIGADRNGDGGAVAVYDFDAQDLYFYLTYLYVLPFGFGTPGDNFGTSVAISDDGSTAVVGADAEDVGAGKAWVLDLSGAMMEKAAIAATLPTPLALVDPEGEVGEQFGASVAIQGDLIAVGAVENNDMGVNSGAVFLFGRDVGGAGNWGMIEQANAPNASESDRYGTGLAIYGDTMATGAPLWRDPELNFSQGAAYVARLPEPDGTLLAATALGTLLWRRRAALRNTSGRPS